MINVVVFCGGRGDASITNALLDFGGINVTQIVNAFDDGKSTGVVRKTFNMPGPSDLRKSQLATSSLPKDDIVRMLFELRFEQSPFPERRISHIMEYLSVKTDPYLNDKRVQSLWGAIQVWETVCRAYSKWFGQDERNYSLDMSVGNMIYAGLFYNCEGNFSSAVRQCGYLLRSRSNVIPHSDGHGWLTAIDEDGHLLPSEADIVERRLNTRIKSLYILSNFLTKETSDALSSMTLEQRELWLETNQVQLTASRETISRILEADLILYSPGTLHSSLCPTFLANGLADAIQSSSAQKICITNIGEDYETPEYSAQELIYTLIKYLCSKSTLHPSFDDFVSLALVNQPRLTTLSPDTKYVFPTDEGFPCNIVRDNFEDSSNPGKHDGKKVLNALLSEGLIL